MIPNRLLRALWNETRATKTAFLVIAVDKDGKSEAKLVKPPGPTVNWSDVLLTLAPLFAKVAQLNNGPPIEQR